MTVHQVPTQRSRGRPTTFRPDIADQICWRLTEGESLRAICRDEGMPPASTVMTWAMRDEQGFREDYNRARELQAWSMADEIIDIADAAEGGVKNARLQIKTRMWLLSKMLPKTFG
jgi:hypothetical protein